MMFVGLYQLQSSAQLKALLSCFKPQVLFILLFCRPIQVLEPNIKVQQSADDDCSFIHEYLPKFPFDVSKIDSQVSREVDDPNRKRKLLHNDQRCEGFQFIIYYSSTQQSQMNAQSTPLLTVHTQKQARVGMIGLKDTGKTNILSKLALSNVKQTVLSPSLTVHSATLKNLELSTFNSGENSPLQTLGSHFEALRAIIYVVDSSNIENIHAARDEIQGLMKADDTKGVSFLILSNKKKEELAMSLPQMVEEFRLWKMKGIEWYIQNICAETGEGLADGLNWLSQAIDKK